MNGLEHYREAERTMRSCQIMPADANDAAVYPALEDGVDSTTHALLGALIHATLALAAAMATSADVQGKMRDDSRPRNTWGQVTS